jgi:hypothetical protein
MLYHLAIKLNSNLITCDIFNFFFAKNTKKILIKKLKHLEKIYM